MTTSPDRTLLAVMAAHKGYRERINGWTKFGQWYEDLKQAPGFAVAPWCQMSISWAAEQAGIPDSVIPRMAYTPYAAEWFADRGQWGRIPRVGALVFYDWSGSHSIAAIDHVGIVKGVLTDGRILTLEGNTSNQLLERKRSLFGTSFGYPDYAAVKPATWTEKLVDALPLIKPGDKGPHPKTIFFLAIARGYGKDLDPGVMDPTVYAPRVVDAVKRLQAAKGLPPDGEVGAKTWPKLIAP